MTDKEILSDGREIERDPQTGRFTKSSLSPERAKELQELSAQSKREKLPTAKALLSEQGYDINDAPQFVKEMATQAAKSVQGMAAWRAYHGLKSEFEITKTADIDTVEWGQICPTCHLPKGGTFLRWAFVLRELEDDE